MEYRGGPTLATMLRGGRSLPPPTVAALGQQLLAALQAVHAAGVIGLQGLVDHRDLKPSNVMVVSDEDGGSKPRSSILHPRSFQLVLIDFGIAEIEGAAPAHPARRSGYVVGSPAYMAPELIRGEAPLPASDLWSLGATL